MTLRDIAILKIKNAYYHCIITIISKIEDTTLLQNIDLNENSENL